MMLVPEKSAIEIGSNYLKVIEELAKTLDETGDKRIMHLLIGFCGHSAKDTMWSVG